MAEKSVASILPTKFGNFRIHVWHVQNGIEPFALTTLNLNVQEPVLVRVHSECTTGDTLSSFYCDCGAQKEKALKMISKEGNGIFIYLRQEGRGIGLYEKIRTYNLQHEKGFDTHQANIELGYDPDPREYSIAYKILRELKVKKIRLITNNPSKISELSEHGFEIVEQVPIWVRGNEYNKKYLETKKIKFKHFAHGRGNAYFNGISEVKTIEQIRAIGNFIKGKVKDPFLKISLGIRADHAILVDKEKMKQIEALFQEAKKYPDMVPVLHYSFKKTKNSKNDLLKIHKELPSVRKIQLNDVPKNHLRLLQLAVKLWKIFLPINDTTIALLDNKTFIVLAERRKILIILDNSGGKGVSEEIGVYKKKIQSCLNKGLNTISIAGGFGPNKLETYFQLKDYFRINFSIDAETNLKTNNELDLDKVEEYLTQLFNPSSELYI